MYPVANIGSNDPTQMHFQGNEILTRLCKLFKVFKKYYFPSASSINSYPLSSYLRSRGTKNVGVEDFIVSLLFCIFSEKDVYMRNNYKILLPGILNMLSLGQQHSKSSDPVQNTSFHITQKEAFICTSFRFIT